MRTIRRVPTLILFLLILMTQTASAQMWHTITCAMESRELEYADGRLWTATQGGLLSFEPIMGDMQILNIDDGFGSNH